MASRKLPKELDDKIKTLSRQEEAELAEISRQQIKELLRPAVGYRERMYSRLHAVMGQLLLGEYEEAVVELRRIADVIEEELVVSDDE